jgi:hypothetical protein
VASRELIGPAVQGKGQHASGDEGAGYCPTSTASSLVCRLDDKSRARRRHRRRRAPIIVLVLLAATLGDDPALANELPPEPPPEASAVDAYRESVPTSAGPHVVGVGSVRSAPLSPAIRRRLRREGGGRASILEHIATSADLGAPDTRRRGAVAGGEARLPAGWAPREVWAAVRLAPDRLRMLILLGVVLGCAAGALALRLRTVGARHRAD